nr:hypothetical protein [Tanacetum cinerariifolium]
MRELVMKYKTEKVCHEEMVKMPLVDLKVLEAWWFCLRMLEALGVRDEESDLDGSRASTTHFQSKELNMRKGGLKPRRVRDICWSIQVEISEKMLVAEIGESKMIGLEMEQEMTKVVMIKERLKEAKGRQKGKGVVRFGKKGELAPSAIFFSSGISLPLQGEPFFTSSGKVFWQWELITGSGNALRILFPTIP